jgi:flagellin
MNAVTLTSGMRQNLFSMQRTSKMLSINSTRLNTGKKVNSALDDPISFFTSIQHLNRAKDLMMCKAGMGEGIQTIRAASNGIDSMLDLIESAESLAQSALSAESSEELETLSNQYNEILNQISGVAEDASYKGVGLLRCPPESLCVNFNETGDSSLTVEGECASAGGLGLSEITDGAVDSNTDPNPNPYPNAKFVNDIQNSQKFDIDLDGFGGPEITGVTSDGQNLTGDADLTIKIFDEWGVLNTDYPDSTVTGTGVNGGSAQNFEIDLNGDESADIIGTTITNPPGGDVRNIQIAFDLDTATGIDPASITATGYCLNGESVTGASLTVINQSAITTNVTGFKIVNHVGPVTNEGDATNHAFEVFCTSLDPLNTDGEIKIYWNSSDATWSFTDSADLQETLTAITWDTSSTINTSLDELAAAKQRLRTLQEKYSTNLNIITTRSSFTDSMVNVLQTGADNLTNADMNEEGANALMLQTQQSLGMTSLSLGAQAAQSVLRLFN